MLDSDEVRADKGDVVHLPECPHHSAVVNARNQNGEEVSQKCGLFLEVERQRFVVTIEKDKSIHKANNSIKISLHLDICSANNHILELIVLPRICRSLNHSKSGVIL